MEVKGHEKCIFETPYNEIKCVLSIIESYSIEKMGQNFYICLWSGPTGLPPPLTVCSFVFYDSPKLLIEFQHKMHESVVVLFYNDL